MKRLPRIHATRPPHNEHAHLSVESTSRRYVIHTICTIGRGTLIFAGKDISIGFVAVFALCGRSLALPRMRRRSAPARLSFETGDVANSGPRSQGDSDAQQSVRSSQTNSLIARDISLQTPVEFPALIRREFCCKPLTQRVNRRSDPLSRAQTAKFPVFFPVSRESQRRDRFAGDCFLRQSVRAQRSLVAHGRARKSNYGGRSRANLSTAIDWPSLDLRSLRPLFSKAQDSADSVRNPQAIDIEFFATERLTAPDAVTTMRTPAEPPPTESPQASPT